MGGAQIRAERNQLRWFRRPIRMPPGYVLGEVFPACPQGEAKHVSPSWLGKTSVSHWKSWKRWRGGPGRPSNPDPDKQQKLDRWISKPSSQYKLFKKK